MRNTLSILAALIVVSGTPSVHAMLRYADDRSAQDRAADPDSLQARFDAARVDAARERLTALMGIALSRRLSGDGKVVAYSDYPAGHGHMACGASRCSTYVWHVKTEKHICQIQVTMRPGATFWYDVSHVDVMSCYPDSEKSHDDSLLLDEYFRKAQETSLETAFEAPIRIALNAQIPSDEKIVSTPEFAGHGSAASCGDRLCETSLWYVKTQAHICKIQTLTTPGAGDSRVISRAWIVEGCFRSPN